MHESDTYPAIFDRGQEKQAKKAVPRPVPARQ
jgi:hypothetical protein